METIRWDIYNFIDRKDKLRGNSMRGEEGLERFVKAQKDDYAEALSEMKNGHKESHWIWYIFPQMRGLGYSSMSEYYGIKNLDEAKAYLKHPVLGKRLIEISEALLSLDSNDARNVMGYPDDLKLRSSMTLFHLADPSEDIFKKVLEKFFSGKPDPETVNLINVK